MLPFAVALVCAGALRAAAGARRGSIVASASVALGFTAAYLTITGQPPFPPRASDQKLIYAVFGGVLAGGLLDSFQPPRWASLAGVVIACLGGLAWLVLPLLRSLDLRAAVLVLGIALWCACISLHVGLAPAGRHSLPHRYSLGMNQVSPPRARGRSTICGACGCRYGSGERSQDDPSQCTE